MGNDTNGTVLYIGGFELPDKNAAAQRVLANAKLFREIGYNTVLIGISKNIEYNTYIGSTLIEYDGFLMYSVAYPKNIWQWGNYLTDAKKYTDYADKIKELKAIVCYNFPSVALEKVRRYCVKAEIKCIADVTEWYSGRGRSFLVKMLKGADTFYRMRIVQKKLDALIVISRYLERYYSGCKNIVYIPPLTDFKQNLHQRDFTSNDESLKLVYAGSPGLKDRINLLIEALSKVKRPVHLDIIGISEEEYLSLYPDHEINRPFTPNIVFHGRLPHATTVEYVQKASFSCFFRYEDRVTKAGFPTKFSEAISLGTPVITNESSNVEEYIRDGVNGILIELLNVDEIAKAIDNAKMDTEVDVSTFNYHRYIPSAKKLLK